MTPAAASRTLGAIARRSLSGRLAFGCAVMLASALAASPSVFAQSHRVQYTYDVLDRITSVRTADRVITYTYDAAGNRLLRSVVVIAPVPTLAAVQPTTGPATGGTILTLSGTAFTSPATVTIGGASATDVVVVDAHTITARTPAHDPGSADVTLSTGGGTVTLPAAFTFAALPPDPPSITTFAPTTGPAGTEVTISGMHFVGATAVEFAGAPAAFSVTGPTSVVATVPGGAVSGPVSVTTPGGSATSASAFTVLVSDARRSLPTCYVPGHPVIVNIDLRLLPSVFTQTLADAPPAGWTIGAISDSGQWESANARVLWGSFPDATPRTLSYVVTPPSAASQPAVFAGVATFNGVQTTVGGQSVVDRCEAHPADVDADFRLVIGEVTAYGGNWRRGLSWDTPPNPIPIGYVTRAGFLWRSGELYRREADPECPTCWVPVEARPLLLGEAMLLPPGDVVRTHAFR